MFSCRLEHDDYREDRRGDQPEALRPQPAFRLSR